MLTLISSIFSSIDYLDDIRDEEVGEFLFSIASDLLIATHHYGIHAFFVGG